VSGRSGRIGAGLVGLVALLYAPLLSRGFTSEDFLLLRVLRQRPPWADLQALFTEPWLGVEVVRFYRPLGELMLALEARWFGGEPLAYNLVHVALHALNVLLVWRIALRLSGGGGAVVQRVAAVAAILFAVHPLHPNAVAWIASYATLFATTLLLAAWWGWEGARTDPGRPWRWAFILTCYAGALGCYEAAVVLPAALALREAVLPEPRPGRRRRLLLTAVPGLLAAGYLGLRHHVLGAAVGGYASFTEDLMRGGPGRLAVDALTSLRRAVHPVYSPAWPPAVGWAVLAVAVLLPLAFALPRRAGAVDASGPGAAEGLGPAGSLGWWAFGWGWALLFLAPFAFRPFVPANGRFVYLASVGLALSLAPLAGRVSWPRSAGGGGRLRRAAGVAALAVVTAIALHWTVLFFAHAADLGRAGELAVVVRDELLSVAAAVPMPEWAAEGAVSAPLLVAGHPLFVTGPGGTPRAQVLRYGLSDALGPPFVAADAAVTRPVYPLPAGGTASAAAAFAAAGTPASGLAWDEGEETFRPFPPTVVSDAVAAELTAGAGRVTARPVTGAARHRLVVLTRGNPTLIDLAPGRDGRLEAAAPWIFIRSMRRLYGGVDEADPVWWWVEATGPAGQLLAVSPARAWPPVEGS